jgi:hypothetical protein
MYKGYTIQPLLSKAGTGLSSHEVNQPGSYRDVTDTTVVAQFKAINETYQLLGRIRRDLNLSLDNNTLDIAIQHGFDGWSKIDYAVVKHSINILSYLQMLFLLKFGWKTIWQRILRRRCTDFENYKEG